MKKKPADYSNIMSKLFSNGLPLVAPYVSNTSQKSSSKKYSLQNLSPSISQKNQPMGYAGQRNACLGGAHSHMEF